MFVERMLPVARERLVTISDDALVQNAARLLDGRHINLVEACDSSGAMVGGELPPNRARCKRGCGQEIESHLEAIGRVLDPTYDEGTDIAAEIVDGVDECDRARCGRTRPRRSPK
jgi:hypothetical protein